MSDFASDATGNVETSETADLIAASKVNGTSVYGRNQQSLGSINEVMISKRSGQVAYAVLSFGGFLGLGSDYYPLPWSMLTYDTALEGYVIDIDENRLKGAPSYAMGTAPWSEREFGRNIDSYYGVMPFGGY